MKWLMLLLISTVFLAGCTVQTTQDIPTGQVTPSQGQVVPPSTGEQLPSQIEEMQIETTSYKGQVIAGDVTKYIRFNQDDYEKALSEGKVIYFYFYANWCPICRQERPKILEAFNELNYPNVVGFEVHFNDDEVTPDDEKIAKQLGISYQHTSVIHVVGIDKTGKEAFRSLSPISKQVIKDKIGGLV